MKYQIKGSYIVITGTLSIDRKFVYDAIEQAGGFMRDSVTKKVSFLVVGEAPGARKLRQAHALDTPIIDADELFKMLPELRERAEFEFARMLGL